MGSKQGGKGHKLRPVACFLSALAAAAIFSCAVWYIAIPDSVVSDLIEGALKNSSMSVQVTHLRKGLFFNLAIDSIALKKSGNTLLTIENATARINPFSLFMMRLALYFSGDLGGGKINGRVDLLKGKDRIDVHVGDAHLEDVPFFSIVKLEGKGVLSGDITLENNRGSIRLEIREAALKTGTFGGVTVPLEMFDTARGAFSLGYGMLKVTSFSLEGKGIYARIKGVVVGGNTNLTMELMPDKSLMAGDPVFSLLENYRVSPGFYSIPINGNLPL